MFDFVASPKVRMINVRLKPETHDDFKLACELRGGSMSSILHQFIVRTIREEKENEPRAFKRAQTSNIEPSASKAALVKNLGELSDERKHHRKRAK